MIEQLINKLLIERQMPNQQAVIDRSVDHVDQSGLARFSIPGYSAYGAMKGAVETLTRYLAKELGPRKIRVNVIAPGVIETDFTKAVLSHAGARGFLASNIALGRVGEPDDIGGVVTFLCSDAGGWVNGQRIEASGGMFL